MTRPSDKLLKSLLFQLNNSKGSVPKELAKGWLWKSHSEQHDVVDLRANKPVLLTPKGFKKKYKKILLYATNGKKIGEMLPSGMTDGRYVYRHYQKMGFQLAKKAIKLTGCPFIEIKAGGKSWGFVNPAFRNAEYRNNN